MALRSGMRGGDILPLPHHEAGKIHRALYEAASPDLVIDVGDQYCLQCGKKLRVYTQNNHLDGLDDNGPKTLEDCQRLSNHQVVALHGVGQQHPKHWKNIGWFETWDGESYQDHVFCSDKCAAIYGRRAAEELPHLPVGGMPTPPPKNEYNYVRHYEEKPLFINGIRF